MKKTVLASRAPSTTSGYLRSLKKWKEFADKYTHINYFPAESTYVALYLQHIVESTTSLQAVQSAFYAIKWAHDLSGLPSPTDNNIVKLVMEGVKRSVGTRTINRKEPFKLEHLDKLISKTNLDNLLNLRNVCMYSLAFSGMLRFDDLIRIRRNDLDFNTDHLKVNIIKSKNDQLREANAVLISDSPSPHSTVKLLKNYLSRSSIPEACTKFIFRPMVKSKSTHRLTSDDRHISYTTFREHLKANLTGIVEDICKFGTHSFRAGGATIAAKAGINERILQRHGRWKSTSSKNMYIKDEITKKLEVSKVIQSGHL